MPLKSVGCLSSVQSNTMVSGEVQNGMRSRANKTSVVSLPFSVLFQEPNTSESLYSITDD